LGNENNSELTQEAFGALKEELEAEKAKSADAETRASAQVTEVTRPLQERIASLELEIKSRDEAIEKHRATIEEKTNGFASLAVERDSAVKAYSDLVKKSNSLVPGEMITGNSIAEINTSLENAVAIVEQVKKSLEMQSQNDRVPPGSPGRTEPDTGSMSSKEKITFGLNKVRINKK